MTKIFKWPLYQVILQLLDNIQHFLSLQSWTLNVFKLINLHKTRLFFSVRHLMSYNWMNLRFCTGAWFFLAHTFPSVSASYWHTIWCWHRPPWERKGDKERRGLTSYWTLSRTVGISIPGKIQKMVKLHVDSQRDYRELKNRRAGAVEAFSSA